MPYATNRDDGTGIHYTVEGSGPPLLLFHGSGNSSDLWRGLGYVDALRDHYSLILMDGRGHGRSAKPHDEDAYSMELVVADIVAVLDALEIERTHYFGYSWGGRVGYGIGRYAPDRFRSLIIGGGSYATEPGWFDRLIFPGALETIASEGMMSFLDAWEQHLGTSLPDEIRAMYLANDAEALAACLRRSDREPSFEDALPRMTMPVLTVTGDQDLERLEQSRGAAARLPDGTFVALPGADHTRAILQREAILPHVREFLQRVQEQPVEPLRHNFT